MKRLHISLAVEDLDRSVAFYSSLFATEPTVRKADYAKWMLDDPRVNFAVQTRGTHKGLDHMGIQVETRDELVEVYDRLTQAGAPSHEEGETVCCYARSEKSWVIDPEGIAWETFLTTGDSPDYGTDIDVVAKIGAAPRASGCC